MLLIDRLVQEVSPNAQCADLNRSVHVCFRCNFDKTDENYIRKTALGHCTTNYVVLNYFLGRQECRFFLLPSHSVIRLIK